MKKTIFFLLSIITMCVCGQSGQKKSDGNVSVTDTLVKKEPVLPVIDPKDSLKIRYIPAKVKMDRKTLQHQKLCMEKWETAVMENRQEDVIKALENAARYKNGEACYRLGEIYKSGEGIRPDLLKADSLFYYSAVYGYKPGVDWLNSGEGVFMPDGEISMPEFPGGEEALKKYIYAKTEETFDDGSGSLGFQGRVIVRFIIEKDGSIKYAKVIQNTTPTYMFLERVIPIFFKNMPKWKPATWQGQSVRSFMTCPVIIKLMM